jgi:hypothetical protein
MCCNCVLKSLMNPLMERTILGCAAFSRTKHTHLWLAEQYFSFLAAHGASATQELNYANGKNSLNGFGNASAIKKFCHSKTGAPKERKEIIFPWGSFFSTHVVSHGQRTFHLAPCKRDVHVQDQSHSSIPLYIPSL